LYGFANIRPTSEVKSEYQNVLRRRAHRAGASALARLTGAALILIFASGAGAAPSWQSTISTEPPGTFPELRPLGATYNFGWSGLTAATADVHCSKPSANRFQVEGTGRTIGLVRALWKFDVSYRALCDASNLRPVESNQIETIRSKKIATHLTFNNNRVTRTRTDDSGPGKPKDFSAPNLFDLYSALLYLRSQPLKERTSQRVVVYPATSAYVATVTVLGREKVNVRAGSYSAIKLDLQLSKVGKNFQLEPHKKFRKATIWVSDDPDRLILRVEAQIFVGTIFAELQSVRLDSAKP
jgi:hypothetical protein